MKCKSTVLAAVMVGMAASCWGGAVVTDGMKDAGKAAAVAMAEERGEGRDALLVSTQMKRYKVYYTSKNNPRIQMGSAHGHTAGEAKMKFLQSHPGTTVKKVVLDE